MHEGAGHEVPLTVRIEPVLAVTVEQAGRVEPQFVGGLAPKHQADFLVRRDADRTHSERTLHEGDVFVARSVLHRERSIELAELEIQNRMSAIVQEDVSGLRADARGLRASVASGRFRGGDARSGGRSLVRALGIVESSCAEITRDAEPPTLEKLAADFRADSAQEERGLERGDV